jgi:hypothetical protein
MDIRVKNYLSWSQINLYLTEGREEYRRVYILGGERKKIFRQREVEFGKKIADGLIDTNIKDREVDFCRKHLPSVDIHDEEEMIKFGNIKLLIKPDGQDTKEERIDEYKTGHPDPDGDEPWNQKKADELGQLTFYVFGKFIKTGRIWKSNLIWIPTDKVLTGKNDQYGNPDYKIKLYDGLKPVIWEVKKTISDMALMGATIKRIDKDILAMTKEELDL